MIYLYKTYDNHTRVMEVNLKQCRTYVSDYSKDGINVMGSNKELREGYNSTVNQYVIIVDTIEQLLEDISNGYVKAKESLALSGYTLLPHAVEMRIVKSLLGVS